jgi:hypothetical protein
MRKPKAAMIFQRAFPFGESDRTSLLHRSRSAGLSAWLLILAAVGAGIGLPASAQNAEQLPVQSPRQTREQWGAPDVRLTHVGGHWKIAGKKNQVDLNQADLAVAVTAEGVSWKMQPSQDDDVLVKTHGQLMHLALKNAGKIEIVPYDTGFETGLKMTLSDFRTSTGRGKAEPIDLILYLTICLANPDEDLVMSAAANEHEATIRLLDWPTAMDANDVDYTVLSNGEGTLVPRNWPTKFLPDNLFKGDGTSVDDSVIESHLIESWSMSWWGFEKGKSAMMVIVEAPDDAAYQFSQPAGGPTVIGPQWRDQLGRLAYPRRVRMCFFPDGNYVTLAKRYRQYAIDSGLFVSLKEKIARQPLVAGIIGAGHTGVEALRNFRTGAWQYDPVHTDVDYKVNTFDDLAKGLGYWKEQGFDKMIVTLSGWPYYGYDRQHPNVLPPAPQAGGWDGMKRLLDDVEEIGYVPILHDQYRDYYTDAPSWDPQFAVHDEDAATAATIFPGSRFKHWEDGSIPMMDHWNGGAQSYLSPSFILGNLISNYEDLFAHGIHPQGSGLDVFGYVPPDRDFNPEHPATRTDGMNARAAAFNWVRGHLGIVGTEAGSDWVIPYVDMSTGHAYGKAIPVPLYNLVYHDAIVTMNSGDSMYSILLGEGINVVRTAAASGRGGNGTRARGGATEADAAKRAALHPAFTEPAQILKLEKDALALQERVGLLEMTNHEFLDKDYRIERTTFSDGTTVTVDWDKMTYDVNPPLAAR